MTIPPLTKPVAPVQYPSTKDSADLRKTADGLEGVFVQQMYKAMRETVPEDGLLPNSGGEEMFTGLLDEHLAADTPKEWNHGLSEAIYRQLQKQVHKQLEATVQPPTVP